MASGYLEGICIDADDPLRETNAVNHLRAISPLIGTAALLLSLPACHNAHARHEALFPCRLEQYFGLIDAWGYIKFKHDNNLLPLSRGTELGNHGLDVLQRKWQAEYRNLYPDR
jgi:hypothetical protein